MFETVVFGVDGISFLQPEFWSFSLAYLVCICSRKERSVMTNIYVGNLSYNATEEDVRVAFEGFGEVTSVNIIKDRETGRSRGFAARGARA